MERYLENKAHVGCVFLCCFRFFCRKKGIYGAISPTYGKHDFEDRLHMKQLRNLLTRYLTVFLFFFSVFAFSQTPESAPEQSRPFHNNVRTILLLTSYPVADVTTSNFFDSFRRSIRELNLPIDCHVVELNATHKGNEDRVDATFARLERSLNDGLYSIVVTLNHEAANVIMKNYDRFPRSLPVLFAGLVRIFLRSAFQNLPPAFKIAFSIFF